MAKIVETPLMKQYFDIKAKHPDAILLFRVGDFYEMYGEDAVTGAEILGIVQTKRANVRYPVFPRQSRRPRHTSRKSLQPGIKG